MNNSNDHTNIQIYLTHIKKLYEVQVLINQLDFKNSYSVDKFVQYNNVEIIIEITSDEEILKVIISNN